MPYTPPIFNLAVAVWRATLNPKTQSPSLTTVGNLAWGKRTASVATGGTGTRGIMVTAPILLLPQLTDIRTQEKGAVGDDYVEVPTGSGRYYQAVYVDDIGKGFSNEHRACILIPALIPWHFPIA